ncbi:translation elongation factor Ts [Candidatus Beckwithbacteria bacterium CG23_combo_of_CG06-09_8_20_14_all_34_8]|uniref:Elongation factor Ts n=1 Tax=Candidatus Beckwithbacteria bacterium CG23_combo_of_CG06-09_8_20_14_all_34_8 TaxID=1974497 RepID=A0A2H0B7D2_9BACT|nr:MAG: translation elongation factor Ts [Candidatus Beckwithbacteria bacterium CG23_combo_of_CG06-09_8_20_14_all_34_8]
MTISIDQVKKLRAETKAGVMEVRKALEQSKGDMKKAKKWLIEQGLSKAAKKADRETGDGLIAAYIHNGQIGALVKVGCETDFVAKTEEFQTLCKEIAMQVASMNPESIEELLAQAYIRDSKQTINDLIKSAIAKIGENIVVLEIKRMEI